MCVRQTWGFQFFSAFDDSKVGGAAGAEQFLLSEAGQI